MQIKLTADKKMLSGNLEGLTVSWFCTYPSFEQALEVAEGMAKWSHDAQGTKCEYSNVRAVNVKTGEEVELF